MVKLENVPHTNDMMSSRRVSQNEMFASQPGPSNLNGAPPAFAKIEIPYVKPTDCEFRMDVPAASMRVQHLKKQLDVTKFVNQLEKLLAQPIKIPSSSVLPQTVHGKMTRHSIFSVKGVWNNEAERIAKTSKLYNLKNLKSRAFLRDLLLEESDSESEPEMNFTQKDLHALLKIHRTRRQHQKLCTNDATNNQYMYYGAGLLSVHDPFPDHQASVLRQHPQHPRN